MISLQIKVRNYYTVSQNNVKICCENNIFYLYLFIYRHMYIDVELKNNKKIAQTYLYAVEACFVAQRDTSLFRFPQRSIHSWLSLVQPATFDCLPHKSTSSKGTFIS